MSKPVPIYGDLPRPCSPACALHQAPQCLTASPVSPPVHDVSTTPATTRQLPSARVGRPEGRSGAPRSATPGNEMSVPDGAQAAPMRRILACIACRPSATVPSAGRRGDMKRGREWYERPSSTHVDIRHLDRVVYIAEAVAGGTSGCAWCSARRISGRDPGSWVRGLR